jgi:nucleoside-diphosphate-sugar epimerase
MQGAGEAGRPERVLVTGATGFIGSHLVAALLARGSTVRALVRDERRAAGLDPRVERFLGDLRVPGGLAGIERDVDAVVHAASLLGKWGTDEKLLHEVNVRGTLELLQRFAGTRLRRFVHISAGGVTGPVSATAAAEDHPCRPATAYERTKLLAERGVLELAARMRISASVARPTFTYGPGDPHKVALFRAVRSGRYVFIGGGTSVNHPVFIDDAVAGILLVLDRGRAGEVYLIGGERPVSKRELVDAIADALGVPRPRRNVPRWLAAAAAPVCELAGRTFRFEPILTRSRVMMMADNFGYSIRKAREELGYRPRTSLGEGIALTVRHYVAAGVL